MLQVEAHRIVMDGGQCRGKRETEDGEQTQSNSHQNIFSRFDLSCEWPSSCALGHQFDHCLQCALSRAFRERSDELTSFPGKCMRSVVCP